jgi:hypothetical protein
MTNGTKCIIKPPTPPIVEIHGFDGRVLLSIHTNGTVEGDIEDASEAARMFVKEIRRLVALPTQGDALREALERIEAATRNEVRAGDKGYISRYGINGIALTALGRSK